ncbi:MAG: hypothetical protein ACLQIB_10180 [Isosphaeraceae bacterium]
MPGAFRTLIAVVPLLIAAGYAYLALAAWEAPRNAMWGTLGPPTFPGELWGHPRFLGARKWVAPSAPLKLLDERVEKTGLAYARFMDDWVILAPTRWKLRAAIRLINQTLAELHVVQHPDKTFIGRISRGFDFLGYAFTPAGLEVAPQAVERCVQRVSQLYEQGVDMIHIGAYVRRWQRWATSGLAGRGAWLGWLALCRVLAPLCGSALRCPCVGPCCPAMLLHTIGDGADAAHTRHQ